jgi:23S rRNA pseudouridine1911/1915/1917 synthase
MGKMFGGDAIVPVALVALYEDGHLLAVEKLAGMVTHPAYRHPDGTLADVVFARQAARGEGRPWLLHRLDRETSGVVLFAKTMEARRALVRQFERRTVGKRYFALLAGGPAADAGVIEAPLARDPSDRRRVIVTRDGQPAATRFRVLARHNGAALALVEPLTGRTHQIRVHMASLGAPLIGDALYGDGAAVEAASEGQRAGKDGPVVEMASGRRAVRDGPAVETAPEGPRPQSPAKPDWESPDVARRVMLHAWRLAFRYPTTGEPFTVTAPLPADLVAVATALGLAQGFDELRECA